MNVEDIMTREVSSVTPDTSIQAAAKLMADRHVSGLPVIEADGRLVGIITDNDLILRQKRRETMTWWRSLVSAPARLAREYRQGARRQSADPRRLPSEQPIARRHEPRREIRQQERPVRDHTQHHRHEHP